jgi:hypothetical protein
MLAFWLLAALAAAITSAGLHDTGATVAVRGAPAVVTRTAPTELVLGETLRPAPGAALPSLAVLGHAAAQARPAAAEALTSPTRAPVAHTERTRVRSTATTKPTTRPEKVRATSSPTVVESTSLVRHGHGKGLAKGQARGKGPSARGKSGH